MARDPSILILLGLVLISTSPQSNTPITRGGIVSGVVTDDSHRPVPGLTVVAQPPGDPHTSASTRTDVDGRFRLAVEFGKYVVLTMDEHGNFSDCHLNLFSCDLPLVEVSPTSPATDIVLKTRKAARVHGTIKDRATGMEISNASVLLRRGDNYSKGFTETTGPTFSLVVPADVELTFSVSVYKYRLWTYRAPKTDYATLRVAPGQDMVLDVEMVRVDQ